ncbi:ATP-dependent endonuclease [Micromonospora tulbaghiae]|uniref:ATP-dependent nuclease n=1 Tax=Micromonospora tulbaghiae TaxID=479978 RepID=UPI0033C09E4F
MHINSFRIKNFRRLKDAYVTLDKETTIFVGANNSGKTSATHVFPLFLGNQRGRFQLYDFTADCWDLFNQFDPETDDPESGLPRITLDLWFTVDEGNLHRIVDLIPSLEWDGQPVGVRLEYMPRDPTSLLANFHESLNNIHSQALHPGSRYKPWPENLTDYLTRRLRNEYVIRYSVLDYDLCDSSGLPLGNYLPHVLGFSDSGTAKKVESLIRVDFLSAQRHLTDADSHGRAEELSKRLSRFYTRNLEKRNDDIAAFDAIMESEEKLNAHFANVFGPTLDKLTQLGYPGLTNPSLVIKASFNPESILNTSARIHYALPSTGLEAGSTTGATLPDHYNGLGFKNLIYMVVEVLDFHHAWTEAEDEIPPIHLVMIEEPEAHLHAQLQQVFVRKIRDILPETSPDFTTQMIVTTHSSHVIYESNFEPIRYFKRSGPDGNILHSDVRNLSTFHNNEEQGTRDFIRRYLKLTHCDLFFADAAILVEGNVERLLIPLIIHNSVRELRACHLTIMELGGAFAHKFKSLLEFLGLTTLVITDLDSVHGEDQEDPPQKAGSSCMTTTPKAITSNETLRTWLPSTGEVKQLLALSDKDKCPPGEDGSPGRVRIAYQTKHAVVWANGHQELAGRTFEEAFALENMEWCQDESQRELGLVIPNSSSFSLKDLHGAIYNRVKTFDKTAFALGLIAKDPSSWSAPRYIVEGLQWLTSELVLDSEPLAARDDLREFGEE